MKDKVLNEFSHEGQRNLVVFSLDGRRYGLDLNRVIRVVRAVAVTPIPQAPAIVQGVIDIAGKVIPVVNIRERFNHPERGLRLTDQFIIAEAGGITAALRVDDTQGVLRASPETLAGAKKLLRGSKMIEEAVTLADGLILSHDLASLLSLEEEEAINRAISIALSETPGSGGGDGVPGEGAAR